MGHREEDQANNYVQQVAMAFANGVEATFYYQFDEGPMTDRWSYGMVGRSHAYMKAIYFAVATMARNTDFAETVRQEKLLDDVFLTTVARGGTETLLIYKAAGAVDVQIEVENDGPISAEDIFGNRFSLEPVDGKAFFTITQSPLYIMRKRADVTISKAAFQLVSHAESISVGAKTASLRLSGDVTTACTSGVVQAGFLSENSTAGSPTGAQGMNVLVSADAVANEVYDAVLWLKVGTGVVGRLMSAITIVTMPTASRPTQLLI